MGDGSTIGKVARRTGLSVDAIRFYQKRGLVPAPARTPAGYRIFAQAEIEDLQFVSKVQELGFSLTEIRELLVLKRRAEHTCPEVRDLIQRKLSDVRAKIAAMQEFEAQLAQALRKCSRARKAHDDEKSCPVLEEIQRASQAAK